MNISISITRLIELGLNQKAAEDLAFRFQAIVQAANTPGQAWQTLSKDLLSSDHPFDVHEYFFLALFPDWREQPETAPAWLPVKDIIGTANLSQFMSSLNITDVRDFHRWSTTNYEDFWNKVIKKLNIVFTKMPERVCSLSKGVESPVWFPGSALNIVDSCFTAPASATAIIHDDDKKSISRVTYGELNELSNRIANSLVKLGFNAGDAIGIAMPLNKYAIAIYLGILKMGGIVVSIADSFSAEEIAVRLNIANAKAIFTQDFTAWGGKKLPLYDKVQKIGSIDPGSNAANARIIVVPCADQVSITLRENDCPWQDFLVENNQFKSVPCDPMTPCNILFSSGTTGVPKAIVWNHVTPVKAASDAYFHQNIKADDVLAWPTNLGWMMGPWLIFAALINHASIALYSEAPKDRGFGEFIQNAKVTMLGVVPTLVAAWRQSKCMEKLDWSTIKVFSSTGECSNAEDMFYLMHLAGYKPIIEYCGGTEIGGAYISSTVIENNYPSLFSTPTMGLNFMIIDEEGKEATTGEVAIIPPSIGLSTTLLNTDHYQVYYANMPKTADGRVLRRHGDQIRQYPHGHYSILGRVDDTMKLGGIKISAAEIERTLIGVPHVIEVAAIAVPPHDNGPSLLVIYAATSTPLEKQNVMKDMQKLINTHLNPLFKIHDIVLTNDLPKTASNKIMRRILRKQYMETH
jgi:acetyl-CoA synthetase